MGNSEWMCCVLWCMSLKKQCLQSTCWQLWLARYCVGGFSSLDWTCSHSHYCWQLRETGFGSQSNHFGLLNWSGLDLRSLTSLSATTQTTSGCLTGLMSVGDVAHLDYSRTFVTDLRRCLKDGHFLNVAHILSTVFDMRQ